MRTLTVFLLLAMFGLAATAQVKIGQNPESIDPASILELDDNNKALVLTRISDANMNAMSPLRGALVYNTDQGCVFYYDGANWLNLCSGAGTTNESLAFEENTLILTDSNGDQVSVALEAITEQTFTTDPIENFRQTILITQNGSNYNFEVLEITGEQIADFTIQGIDIAEETIRSSNLAPNSVGQSELSENSVGVSEIDLNQVTVSSFLNDAGYITAGAIISPEPGNSIVENNGIYYSDAGLQNQITTNTNNLSQHLTEDLDISSTNELVTDFRLEGNSLILEEGTNTFPVSLEGIGGGDEDGVVSNVAFDGTNLNFTGTNGGFNGNVDISSLGGGGATTSITAGTNVTIDGDGTGGNPYVINALIGDATDGVITNVELNGTDLEFTGSPNGGFTGTISLAGLGGGGSTELADQVTIIGDGSAGDEFRIRPSDFNGQYLRTDPTTGDVIWDDLPAGTGGNTVFTDNTTIIGDGQGTPLTLGNLGAANNQILKWNQGAGNWEAQDDRYAPNVFFGFQDSPFTGNRELFVRDSEGNEVGVEVTQLQAELGTGGGGGTDDQNIEGSVLTGETLTIGIEGGNNQDVDLAPFALETEVATAIAASDAADGDTDDQNEIQAITSLDGSVTITPNGDDFDLSVPGGGTDDQNIEGSILTGETLTIGIEGGNNQDVDLAPFALETEVATAIAASDAADGDTDDQNEIQAITSLDGSVTITPNGDDFDLSVPGGGTDDQNIEGSILTGETLTIGIEGGNNQDVDLAPFALETEVATAIAASDAADGDTDDQNEIQAITSLDGSVTITPNGDDFDLSVPGGGTDDQNIEGSILTGETLTIGIEGGNNQDVDLAPFALETEVATAIAASDAADGDTDDQNEIQAITSLDGSVTITPNGDDFDLSVPGGGTDDQNIEGSILTGETLTIGIEGGNNQDVDLAPFALETEVATAIAASEAADGDTDDQNEIELPDDTGATAGDVLSTDGAGNYSWITPTGGALPPFTQGSVPFSAADGTLTENNAQVFWDATNNRFGIGTNIPQNKFHVTGAGRFEGILNSPGVINVPSYRFAGDTNTGIWNPAADELAFSVGSVEAMRITEIANTSTVVIQENLELEDNLTDVNQSIGNPGDLLSRATGGGVEWVTPAVAAADTSLENEDQILEADRSVFLSSQNLSFTGTGNIIINGDASPPTAAKLQLTGDAQLEGVVSTFGTRNTAGSLPSNVSYSFLSNSSTGMDLTDTNTLGLITNNIERIRINATGAVGIGTGATINANAALHVNGNVYAENGGFYTLGGFNNAVPDYVFQNYFDGFSSLKADYEFQSLADIEAFVKKHKHLPGITSAAQAQKDGFWNLSQSNLQNLEKIEELFLHTIEQQKKIDSLSKENQNLKSELDCLKAEVEAIKNLLGNK